MPSTPSSAPPDAPPRRARLALIAAVAVVAVAGVTIVAVRSEDEERAPDRRAASCAVSVDEPADTPSDGDLAPVFSVPGLHGGCVRLSDLRGRPVIVNFWASWCNPCRREFPRLRDARDDHRDDGLEIIGVTFRDIPSDSRRFAEQEDADWRLGIDEGELVAKAYRVTAIPQTVFVRGDGTISARIFGPVSNQELDAEIRALLRGEHRARVTPLPSGRSAPLRSTRRPPR